MNRRMVMLFLLVPMHLANGQSKKSTNDVDEKERAEMNLQQEQHYRNLMHYALATEEGFQNKVNLSETQIQSIKALHDKFFKDFEQVGAARGKIYSDLQNGLFDQETYKKAITANKRAEENLKKQFHVDADKILLPHQRRMLSQRAKKIRMERVKDEFEIPVILAREKGYSAAEIRRIAKAVNQARKDHYEKLKKIRDRYEKRVLSEMDPELRRRFVKLYGEFYDYGSEMAIELTKKENEDD